MRERPSVTDEATELPYQQNTTPLWKERGTGRNSHKRRKNKSTAGRGGGFGSDQGQWSSPATPGGKGDSVEYAYGQDGSGFFGVNGSSVTAMSWVISLATAVAAVVVY